MKRFAIWKKDKMSNVISTDKVDFYIKEHKYVSKATGKILTSASQLIDFFCPEFDASGQIIANCALKRGVTVEELRKEWDATNKESCDKGREIHAEIEKWIKTGKIKKGKYQKIVEQISQVDFGSKELLSERIVADDDLGLAGTIDISAHLGDNCYRLYDAKSNKKMTFRGFFKKGQGYEKMLYPINHVESSLFHKYSIQLEIYSLLCEQQGHWIDGCEILYINPKTYKIERYPTLPMRQEVLDMIEVFNNRPIKPREIEKIEDDFGF